MGQEAILLRGKILDVVTSQPVGHATVQLGDQFKQVVDQNGEFEFHVPRGKYLLITNHVAYETDTLQFLLVRDTVLQIRLVSGVHLLEETTIIGKQKTQSLSGLSAGRFELNMQELRTLPKFLGNNDPLKILQLLPGIQTAGDGNSGIFIRGGEPGHNMVLWNGAPIYNASHLLGFFSVFNTGHIGEFTLYKSHIPADFGGRLSALIDVQSPASIPSKTTVSGDVGLIASQVTVAVPLTKKSAFYVSGRQTYVGLTLRPLIEQLAPEEDMPFNYEFSDCNFTYVYRPDERNKLVVNAYWGMDKLKVDDVDSQLDGRIKWGNLALSASWEQQWLKKGSSKYTLFYSQYSNRLNLVQHNLTAKLPSQIKDIGFRHKTNVILGKVQLFAGGEYTFHSLSPQSPNIHVNADAWKSSETQTYYTHEAALFLNGRLHITPSLMLEFGGRYAMNFQTGPYDDKTFDSRGILLDSVHYSSGHLFGFRQGLEPRVALQYFWKENQRIQIAYNRQKQWVNLVSISGVGLPTDFWVPASKNIPPQTCDHFTVGYFHSFNNNRYEFSVESYYRKLGQQMEYKEALFDLFNQQYILEQSINYGTGKAYGVEFIAKKNNGVLNGWISYTLGWSKRNFPMIMEGATFSAKHDRRHDLSVVANYKLNEKWDLSAAFVYATGNSFTMATGMYIMGGNLVKEYGKYNGSRMPDYHRLDLSVNYWFFKEKDRESGLNFSIYNVYKHSNPMYIFIVAKPSEYTDDQVVIRTKRKQLYDIIPSISWTFKF